MMKNTTSHLSDKTEDLPAEGKRNTHIIKGAADTQKEAAHTLGSFFEAAKARIPTFIKRLDTLQKDLASAPKEQLLKETTTLKNLLDRFVVKLLAYAKKDGNYASLEEIVCRDLGHKLGNRKVFLKMLAQDFLPDLKPGDNQSLSIFEPAFVSLMEELVNFQEMEISVAEETTVESLFPFVQKTFRGMEIHIDDELKNYTILCNVAIFKNILKEFMQNYEKYGENGRFSMKIENNKLKMTLLNNKKEQAADTFSTDAGLQINKEYGDRLGFSIETDYKTDDCKTVFSLPAHKIGAK